MHATPGPTRHPVYKALHRPLLVCGIERRLFFGALMTGAATFNLFYSFVGGLLVTAGLYVTAAVATRRDPRMLHILAASARLRARYDPMKHDPVYLETGR